MIFNGLSRYRDYGLLILRVGLGIMFLYHGVPKLLGGPGVWEKLGGAMGNLGISFAPTLWGLMAALAEAGGGLALAAGFLFRPACALLTFTMFVAALKHLSTPGEGLFAASHAIEVGIVFLSLILIGPGRFSLDEKLRPSGIK